jgi:hypothetical protein
MLIALCSLKGSPGVTTTAVALAARWPAMQKPIVVECDPAGGDLAARFHLSATPGLMSLAAAARRNRDASVLWQHSQRLPAGIAVVPGPVGAQQAHAALRLLALGRTSVLRVAGDQSGLVVLADCGRVDPESPALPVVQAADAMVLFAHAHDEELSHVAGELPAAAKWNRRPSFVLVGGGYPTDEVERALHIGVLARLPHDAKGADVLCGRHTGAGPSRSALGQAAARLAHDITRRVLAGGTSRPGSSSAHPVAGEPPNATATVAVVSGPPMFNGARP